MSRRASKRRSNRFDVFNFTAEDERVEKMSAAILDKFKRPKKCRYTSSPVDKYNFLQCFARKREISKKPTHLDVDDGIRTKEMETNNGPIDIDTGVTESQFLHCRKTQGKKNVNGPIEIDNEALQSPKTQEMKNIDEPIVLDAKEVEAIKTAQKACRYKFGDISTSVTGQRCMFPAQKAVNMRQEEIMDLDTDLLLISPNFGNEQIGMISDDDRKIKMSSSSALAYSHAECEDSSQGQLPVHCSGGYENETKNMEVVIFPDIMLYRGTYYQKCQLTFLKSFLKFEGLTVNRTKFSSLWTVDDIISINAKWCERVEMVIISLVIQSNNSNRAGNANESLAIDVLKFEVDDPCWPKRQEAIKSLSVRYNNVWNDISDFHENFKEVIYPKGDPDAVSICKRDVELLKPGVFINDTIIDFYIKYLKAKIQPEENRFYFFNSFFFRKLADLDKDLSSDYLTRAAFHRVRKWTRNVDVFEKDYIFVPVNYSFHWSLVVICHPGEVTKVKDGETEKLLKVPCILHMDSIRGSHGGLQNLFRSYLSEEWKERHTEAADDIPSKFLDLPFLPLELPQQENSFDCGLFLLHYVELFLLQAPANFSPFMIARSSNFLNTKWFPPAEASLKRSHIRKLIYEILEEKSCGSTSADSIYIYPPSLLPSRSEQETDIELIEQISISGETLHSCSSNSKIKQRRAKFALSDVSLPTVQQGCNMGPEIQECYDVETCGELSVLRKYQINALNERNSLSPIEEIEETSKESDADSHANFDSQHVMEPCLFMQNRSKDFRVLKAPRKQQMPFHSEDSDFYKSTDSVDSSEIGVEDDQQSLEFDEVSLLQGKIEKAKSCSPSYGGGYSDCIVDDSQELSDAHDEVESTCSSLYFEREISTPSDQQPGLAAEVELKENSILINDIDPVCCEGDEQAVDEVLEADVYILP